MSPSTLSNLFTLTTLSISLVAVVNGQAPTSTYPATPLAEKTFAYPAGVPYKVDTDVGLIRGVQHGYNICNSTTEGPTSQCQTSFINSIDDFCLWGPPEPNSMVANTEGEMVAWCTKPGRGTRLIPKDALTGVQFMKTPDYIQVVGFIKQEYINIAAGDWGGEMDPHGADLRGNPMGGIMFSEQFGPGWTQVREYHNFMGGNRFCLKACDPNRPDDDKFCEHKLDRIGCDFNAPNLARDGVFESCQGDNQDFPGVYTSNGQVLTYTQPPESLGAISTMPYTPRVPASSNCVAFTSASIYAALPTPTFSVPSSAATSSSTSVPSGTGSRPTPLPTSGSRTGSAAGASDTSTTSDASTLAISALSLLGVVFSALFLA